MKKNEYNYEELGREAKKNVILDALIHLRPELGVTKGLGDMYDPQNPGIERDITWSSPSGEI